MCIKFYDRNGDQGISRAWADVHLVSPIIVSAGRDDGNNETSNEHVASIPRNSFQF